MSALGPEICKVRHKEREGEGGSERVWMGGREGERQSERDIDLIPTKHPDP